MSDTITVDELKEAIELWAPKFNLIRELWPGASIEESLKLMKVIEEKAGEIKEEKKDTMGFGPYVEEKSKKLKNEAKSNTTEEPQFYEDSYGLVAGVLEYTEEKQ